MREQLELLNELGLKSGCTLSALIRARCGASEKSVFVRSSNETLTYGDVLNRASAFAYRLWLENPFNESRIACIAGKSAAVIVCWFGAALAERSFVSIFPDHRGPLLERLIRRSDADTLVLERTQWEKVASLSLPRIKTFVFIDGVPEAWESSSGKAFEVPADSHSTVPPMQYVLPREEAGALFTSGSTGESKLAIAGHNYFCRNAALFAQAVSITERDVLLDWAPQCHVGNQIDEVLALFIGGGSLAMVPTFSRTRFWSQIAEFGVTLFGGFANVFKYLLSNPAAEMDGLHSLRLVFAINTPDRLRAEFQARFSVKMIDYYGMTEAPIVTLPDVHGQPPLSCGLPSPDFDVQIQDENGWPKRVGEVGRIVLRPRAPGAMMLRYQDDDSQTICATQNLWFHTQDLGFLDTAGYLYFVDRMSNSIRRGGENIAPTEITAALLEDPNIVDCLVVGVSTDIGDEEVRLVAVLAPNSTMDELGVYSVCRRMLSSHMLPRFIRIVNELRCTEVGKVDRAFYKSRDPADWDSRVHRI